MAECQHPPCPSSHCLDPRDRAAKHSNGNGRYSKRLVAFFSTVASLILTMMLATWMGTPSDIAQHVIIAIAFSGLFIIGGQSLVDAFKFYAVQKTGKPMPDELKDGSV